MAHIEYIDRMFFEELFSMQTGYVLDFSNRGFQEFVFEKIHINIYSRYQGLSKAKILRKIMAEFDDVTVGKLLLELMKYMQSKEMISSENNANFRRCTKIANRLIGKNCSTQGPYQTSPQKKSIVNHDLLLKELTNLSNHSDTPQLRGFAFEKFMEKLFTNYNLEPRGSFKILGEQIDGSFIFQNNVYLIEAKWTNRKIDKSDLVIFNEKVSSKSDFTRGLFISFSGFSDEALSTFATGRHVRIILMTVQELAIALERQLDFTKVLSAKVRALAEEGNFNKSILSL